MKVFYFQYTPPQNYPPLWRSARLFVQKGWEVHFYAPGWVDGEGLRVFSQECGATVHRLSSGGSSSDKLGYLAYLAGAFRCLSAKKPDWIYLSDIYAAPLGILRPKRTSVVYHEHDQYWHAQPSAWMRLLIQARGAACRAADLVVVPNADRAALLRQQTGMPSERCLRVWNCPLREEVVPARIAPPDGPLKLVYSGSIVPDRLPPQLPELMPDGARLSISGYETIGYRGYVAKVAEKAREAGRGRTAVFEGRAKSRAELRERLCRADVGLALLPMRSDDPNLSWMAGASNKPFEYLACGVLPLVPDSPDWRKMFVEPGYALACRTDSDESLRQTLQWAADHRPDVAKRAECGRQRILSDWNYDTQFAPVFDRMNGKRRS